MDFLIRFKHLLILIIGLFLTASLYNCGSNGTSSSYSLSEGNHALMGPLKYATVTIYNLSDNTSIETTTTNRLGEFDVSLGRIPNDKLLLVQVSKGYDIDTDDNGMQDPQPTKNLGTISAYATAKDLREGRVNVTLLSEIVYEYSGFMIKNLRGGTLSQSDFENILNDISSKLITADNSSQAYEDVVKFNPLNASSLKKLKFKYKELVEGKDCLAYLYHKNEKENIYNKLTRLFLSRGLVLNDPRWLNTRHQVKVNVMWNSWANDVSIEVNGNTLNPTETDEKQQSFFVKKDDNITVSINGIEDGYKILRWHGCDVVSEDKNTCYVYDIQNDRIITPVIVPTKIVLSNDYTSSSTDKAINTTTYTVVDITGAYIKLPNIEDNSSVKLNNIPVNSNLLDDIIAYVSSNDNNTINKLNSVKIGDIIVNKSDPTFFRKVTKIQSSKVTGGFKYEFNTVFVPLEYIIKEGYISTSANPADGSNTSNEVRVISRSILLPNGEEVHLDPNKPAKIIINFEKNKAYLSVEENKGNILSATAGPFSIGPIYLDKNKNISIEGSLTIEPHLDVDMGWRWFMKLDYLNIACGNKLSGNITLKASSEKKFGIKPTKLFNAFTYGQKILIGPIPVNITETMPVIYGIKGPGTGKDSDNASIKGSLTVNTGFSFDPTFSVTSNGDKTIADFSLNPNIHGSIDAKASAEAYAYVGVVPTVKVYFLGISMTNDIGPYAEIEAKASVAVASKNPETKEASVDISGKFGLGYYGRIKAMADGNISFIDNIVKNINETIRGEYTEFWKPFLIKTLSYQYTSNQPSSQLPFHTQPFISDLVVSGGPESIYYNKSWSNNLNETVNYVVKNVGPKSLEWKVDVVNHSGNTINIKPSPGRGELEPGETKTLTVTISSDKLPKNGGVFTASIEFYNSSFSSYYPPIKRIPIKIKVAPYINYEGSSNSANDSINNNFNLNILSVKIVKSTINKLQFKWTPTNADVDGYEIFYTEYNIDNRTCSKNYMKFASIPGKSSSSYLTAIDFSKTKPNKRYCFYIFSYKAMGGDPYNRYYYQLLPRPAISPIIPESLSDYWKNF